MADHAASMSEFKRGLLELYALLSVIVVVYDLNFCFVVWFHFPTKAS